MTPFDAPEGVVWHYTNDYNEDSFFLVLNKYTSGEDKMLPFKYHIVNERWRMYLDLLTGELKWFSASSLYNKHATRFA